MPLISTLLPSKNASLSFRSARGSQRRDCSLVRLSTSDVVNTADPCTVVRSHDIAADQEDISFTLTRIQMCSRPQEGKLAYNCGVYSRHRVYVIQMMSRWPTWKNQFNLFVALRQNVFAPSTPSANLTRLAGRAGHGEKLQVGAVYQELCRPFLCT